MSDRLRVCWLVPGFPSDVDDPFYPFLGREAIELCETGQVDLTVITEELHAPANFQEFDVLQLERPTGAWQKIVGIGNVVLSDPKRIARSLKNPRRAYPPLWRLGASLELVGDLDPQVIHSHFAVPSGSCGVPLARSLNAVSIVSLRGVDVAIDKELEYGFRQDPDYNAELHESLASADRCLTATAAMRVLAITAGSRPENTTVLPNSFRRFKGKLPNVERPAGANRLIVSAGSLTGRKGFDRGVRALAEMPKDHHYVIVGEGPERHSLTDLAGELGISGRVHLTGSLPPSDVSAWMRSADCIWFLSRFEAFGNVVLEAFDSGKPVVATKAGVAPDLLNGVASCALLEDPDSPEELMTRTGELIGSAVLDECNRSLERFSPSGRSATLVSIYRDAIGGA